MGGATDRRRIDPLMSNVRANNEVMSHPTPIAPSESASSRVPVTPQAVACGFPSPAQDWMDEGVDVNAHLISHPAASFIVRACGESMEGSGIFDGDELIVDRSLTPADGDVVLAVIDGEFTVKHLRLDAPRRLEPSSERFPTILLEGRENAMLWEVVTYCLRHLRTAGIA